MLVVVQHLKQPRRLESVCVCITGRRPAEESNV